MAAGRPIWSGFIRFGLVSVPVQAYSSVTPAGEGGDISLNQLHRECHSRIQYRKTCPIHGEVPNDQIVKGYEFSRGQYVVVEPEELEKLRTPNEKAVDIQAFMEPGKVDPAYFSGKTWYLLPDGAVAVKPYALMLRAMQDQEMVGFCQVVIAGKKQLLLMRPLGKVLVGSFLSFAAEVKDIAGFAENAPRVEVPPEELKMAKEVSGAMTPERFDLSAYRDDYKEKMTQLIEAKVKGRQVVAPPAVEEEEPQVINLMDALKKSLEKAKAASGKPAKIAAPSVGTAKPTRKRKSS
jgi:DNA end-binding protein Ku